MPFHGVLAGILALFFTSSWQNSNDTLDNSVKQKSHNDQEGAPTWTQFEKEAIFTIWADYLQQVPGIFVRGHHTDDLETGLGLEVNGYPPCLTPSYDHLRFSTFIQPNV